MIRFNWDMKDFSSRVKEEVGAFQNFQAIVEKAEQDDYLGQVNENFRRIFEQEMFFAFKSELRSFETDEERASPRSERRKSLANEYLHFQAKFQTDRRSKS